MATDKDMQGFTFKVHGEDDLYVEADNVIDAMVIANEHYQPRECFENFYAWVTTADSNIFRATFGAWD